MSHCKRYLVGGASGYVKPHPTWPHWLQQAQNRDPRTAKRSLHYYATIVRPHFIRGYVLVGLDTRTCADEIDGLACHGAKRELSWLPLLYSMLRQLVELWWTTLSFLILVFHVHRAVHRPASIFHT